MPNTPFDWSSKGFGIMRGTGTGQPAQAGPTGKPTVQLDSFGGGGMFSGSTVPSQAFSRQPSFSRPLTGGGGNQAPGVMEHVTGTGVKTLPTELQRRTIDPSNPFSQLGSRTVFEQMSGGLDKANDAGSHIQEALLRDYQNLAGARGELKDRMLALLGGVDQAQGLGNQQLQAALDAQKQAAQFGREGLDAMMKQAGQAQDVYKDTKGLVGSTMDKARKESAAGIGEMQKAVDQTDFFRKDVVQGGAAGIQAQFESAKQQINSDPNMSEEDRKAALGNLQNTMRQQTASFVSQNDQAAEQAQLQARSALANMKTSTAVSLGGLGMQGAGLQNQAGMQAAQIGTGAAEAGYQFLSGQAQWSNSQLQNAFASIVDARMKGQALKASLLEQTPFGLPQISESIARAMQAKGYSHGSRVDPGTAGLVGGFYG